VDFLSSLDTEMGCRRRGDGESAVASYCVVVVSARWSPVVVVGASSLSIFSAGVDLEDFFAGSAGGVWHRLWNTSW